MGLSTVRSKRIIIPCADKKQWESVLETFDRRQIRDIYFRPEYVSLYAHNGMDAAEAYVYQDGGESFFLPYIKYEINAEFVDERAYDIETAYGYGGPLSTTENAGFLKEAWVDYFDYCREAKIVCGFIRFHPLLQNHRLAEIAQIRGVEWSNQIVLLGLDKSAEQVLEGYNANTRNKVRKAQRGGATVVSGNRVEDLIIFKKLYYETMDQVSANEFYYFDDSYFNRIFDNLNGEFRVYLTKLGDLYIGGALVLFSKDHVHYHISANIKGYRSYEPATLLRHEVIMANLGSGRKTVLFGGGRSGSADDTLFQFKSGFSKERAEFYIGKLVIDKALYSSICSSWEERYPDKAKIYKNYCLKYKL